MTTSKPTPQEAFVWVWLPQAGRPVVAGKLTQRADQLFFTYGRSYLQRPDAMALYLPELPLQTGTITLLPGLNMPACIRDAAPDAWGVIPPISTDPKSRTVMQPWPNTNPRQ